MRVRARPHTEPVADPPVAGVVRAWFPRACPVRDLVVPVAVTSEERFGELVESRDAVVVGLRRRRTSPPALDGPPAGTRPVRDGLLRLQRELERITGQVIGLQRDRGLQVRAPAGGALAPP